MNHFNPDTPGCNICSVAVTDNSNNKKYSGTAITKCDCKYKVHVECIMNRITKEMVRSLNHAVCYTCRNISTPMSYNFDYGFCDDVQAYFEYYPLSACNLGSVKHLESYLLQNPKVLQKNFLSKEFGAEISLLMYAVLKGYHNVVLMLIRLGANINEVNQAYQSPISQAIKLTTIDIGQDLIEAGVTINLDTPEGINLVAKAISNNHDYVIDSVYSNENNKYDDKLRDILLIAIDNNCYNATVRIIKKGVDVNRIYKNYDVTYLHKAILRGCSKNIISLLAKNMKNVAIKDNYGKTALFLAVQSKQLSIVKTLITFPKIQTAIANELSVAICRSDEEIFHCIYNIINQEKIDITASYPLLLSYAVHYGKNQILETLCSRPGIDLNAPYYGNTPLLNAAFAERLNSAKILLEHGADPNIGKPNDKFATPICIACQNSNLELVKLLVKYKANVDTPPEALVSPLYAATQAGDSKTVQFLLQQGVEVDIRRVKEATALILASSCGHTEVVKILLKFGANHRLQKNDGCTALQVAYKKGHAEIVKILLANGADPKIKNKADQTYNDTSSLTAYQSPIFQDINLDTPEGMNLVETALEQDHGHVIDSIVINPTDDYNDKLRDVLFLAIYNNCLDAIERLIKKGVDVDKPFKKNTYLHYAVNKGSPKVIISLLASNIKNIDKKNDERETILQLAVRKKLLYIVQTLIKVPASNTTLSDALFSAVITGDEDIFNCIYNMINKNGIDITSSYPTMLYDAIRLGHNGILKTLCNLPEINLNIAAHGCFIPLLTAASKERYKAAKILLENGADPNIYNHSENKGSHMPDNEEDRIVIPTYKIDTSLITPINIACQNNNLDLVILLTKHGARVDTSPGNLISPLWTATEAGNSEIVRFLLQQGAKVDIPRVEDATALILAVEHGYTEIVNILLDAQADYSLQKSNGNTALHVASLKGHVEIVNILLQNGADPKIINKKEQTAIDISRLKNHQEIIKLLVTKSDFLESWV